MKQLTCATLVGHDAVQVDVEATFTKGLPAFTIVGLASNAIQESRDRVKSALLYNDFKFPPLKITLNLSPSNIKKEGTHFDLGIALLIALHHTSVTFDNIAIFGELGLDGSVKDTPTIFPLILSMASHAKVTQFIVPKETLPKIARIRGISYIGVNSLAEATELLIQEQFSFSMDYQEPDFQTLVIDQKEYFYTQHYEQDFSDVKGQEVAKRAALIAAAGMHNILFEGSPGSGKSMIAKRLRYILPPLNADELLTIAKHESLRGEEPTFAPKRPFRSPHHSSSKPSLFGGGSGHNAQMGEVAMAHLGLLFFDELPHFAKNSLEALREPLEDRKILISRVNAKLEYDADFMFVSAMNPCPCGNLLSKTRDCRCSDLEISRYQNRLSDPFLDRIDLHVQMQESDSRDQPSVSSKTLHEEVIGAFKQQKMRGQTALNGVLSDQAISKFCQLDEMTQMILDQATQRFALSARSINKVLKVARTIADLSGSHQIEKAHILEALSYRKR